MRENRVYRKKLTNRDKYVIQHAIFDGLTEEKTIKLSQELGITVESANYYINVEFPRIMEAILGKNMLDNEQQTNEGSFVQNVINKLRGMGLSDQQINKAMADAMKKNSHFSSEKALYNACMAELRTHFSLIKKTSSGRDGVVGMTQEASEIVDNATRKHAANKDEKLTKNIHKINEQQ